MSWREMGPGRELDKVIAESLGWRCVELNPPEKMYVEPPGVWLTLTHQILFPDGTPAATAWQNEDLAWEHAPFDEWSTDADEALSLVEKSSLWLVLRHDPSPARKRSYRAEVFDEDGVEGTGYAVTAAEAICRAFLAQRERDT